MFQVSSNQLGIMLKCGGCDHRIAKLQLVAFAELAQVGAGLSGSSFVHFQYLEKTEKLLGTCLLPRSHTP